MATRQLDDLPDNSKSARNREERSTDRHAKPVVDSRRDMSTGRRIFRTFIMEDPKDVAEEIWDRRIVPGIKDAAMDALDMFLKGIGNTGYRSKRESGYGTVRYDKYSSERGRDSGRDRSSSNKRDFGVYDYDDVTFEEADEARSVLQGLFDEAIQYDKVSVAYFYDLANVKNYDYPVNNYGWYKEQIEGLREERVRGSSRYYIPLPKPVKL